jgi:hypothetical protein
LKFVIESMNKEKERKKLPVIKMEIDYELLTLHDAMKAGDKVQIIKSKERLKVLREQLMKLMDTS